MIYAILIILIIITLILFEIVVLYFYTELNQKNLMVLPFKSLKYIAYSIEAYCQKMQTYYDYTVLLDEFCIVIYSHHNKVICLRPAWTEVLPFCMWYLRNYKKLNDHSYSKFDNSNQLMRLIKCLKDIKYTHEVETKRDFNIAINIMAEVSKNLKLVKG